MAQFTSSKTTGGGVVVNAVVDTTSNTTTYTVTAPNGAVATASQNTGSLNPATISSIQTQLNQGGADAQTFSIGLTTALSSTERNASEQAATTPPSVAETQSIPVSTASDPQVPQPTNTVQQDIVAARAAGDIPPAQPLTAAEQANEAAISRIEANRANSVELTDEQKQQLSEVNSRIDAKSPAPQQDEFGNLDAAVAANAAEPATPATQKDIDAGLDEALAAQGEEEDNAPRVYSPEDLGVEVLSDEAILAQEQQQAVNRASLQSEDNLNAAAQAATIARAKEQAAYAARYKSPSNADWRVRLVLAEGATYLYKDPQASNGILAPLAKSNGVIFPYTPQIQTAYTANYDKYDLTHSNYRGYFYKNSAVNDININAVFTAQDTAEAQYLLAVIHFFRAATKMFYGQDPLRGAPPPILYLVGLGEFQFNGHACVISNFQYNLPSDVDYIRATNPNDYGSNMLNRVSPMSATSSLLPPSINRLANAIDKFGSFLKPGALTGAPQSNDVPGTVTNSNRATYVPTKIELNISLLPVQTRSQVSKQFSNKEFANGNLLKGGFW